MPQSLTVKLQKSKTAELNTLHEYQLDIIFVPRLTPFINDEILYIIILQNGKCFFFKGSIIHYSPKANREAAQHPVPGQWFSTSERAH